jgi:hypothetical protein
MDVLTGIRIYIRVQESGLNWYQVWYGDSILGKSSLLFRLTFLSLGIRKYEHG